MANSRLENIIDKLEKVPVWVYLVLAPPVGMSFGFYSDLIQWLAGGLN